MSVSASESHHVSERRGTQCSKRRRRTDADGSSIASTHARLSAVSERIVSVRPFWKSRASAVSYVAVKQRRVRYHASCSAIWMYASGDRPSVNSIEISDRLTGGRTRLRTLLDPFGTVGVEPEHAVVRVLDDLPRAVFCFDALEADVVIHNPVEASPARGNVDGGLDSRC